ncbi:uncharacterized protein QC761_103417 [Podospora bellae-mahoneyi]|uniref:Uncharacterized protein n=1 Tax=Podospora bellae-mahoneyi TaxID=2093777 RepID=A0ABR0FUN4_9PEZI|nr:hypothetical protein QC761_103417 [Podospora bellae-mahoneyi]
MHTPTHLSQPHQPPISKLKLQAAEVSPAPGMDLRELFKAASSVACSSNQSGGSGRAQSPVQAYHTTLPRRMISSRPRPCISVQVQLFADESVCPSFGGRVRCPAFSLVICAMCTLYRREGFTEVNALILVD